MEGTLELSGDQKHIVIFALAELALSRPDLDDLIGEIVDIYNERTVWSRLKEWTRLKKIRAAVAG